MLEALLIAAGFVLGLCMIAGAIIYAWHRLTDR